jgi:hypothetical protein
MLRKLSERCTGIWASSAVLILGLIIVTSLIVEIGVTSLAVEYRDSSLHPVQSQRDASPVTVRANPPNQRGLVLYFLMEAVRAQSR